MLPQRVWDKIEMIPLGGCWVWVGGMSGNGYGSLWWEGMSRPSHKVVFEEETGQRVPDSLVLDHTCRNPVCCNPHHLEIVTESVNIARGTSWHHVRDYWRASETCAGGHRWTPETTHYRADGRRRCRACKTAKQRERRNASKG